MKNGRNNLTLNVFFKTQVLILALTIILFAITSVIIFNSNNIPEKSFFYITNIIMAVSNFSGGFYTGFKLKRNGLITALLFCLPATVLLVILSASMNLFKIDLTLLFSVIIMLCAGMLGGITSVNSNIKSKR